MSTFLTDIEFAWGFFPFTALAISACLWLIFKLTIGMKCHPQPSQHFILAGLLIVTTANFISPVHMQEAADPQPAVAKQLPNEHSGATVSISPFGITYLNHFSLERRNYNNSPISYAAKKPGKWEKLYTGIHSRYLTSGIRRFYQAGVVIVLLYMLWQLLHLRKIRNCSQQEGNFNGISLYNTSYNLPFSYGKYIFLPYNQPEDSREYVLLHEESHIRHKHFYKLCLMLFIAALNWYNPFVWLLLGENKILQEMEADGDVVKLGIIPTDYQMNLVQMALKSKEWIWLKSSYNHHPLKKRILFMNDTFNFKQSRIITYLATLVFVTTTVFIVGCSVDAVSSYVNGEPADLMNEDQPYERNALSGVWHLKGTAKDTTCTDIYPAETECYKFYGNGITLTVIIYGTEYSGLNVRFNASGHTYEVLTDSTMTENGLTFMYRLKTPDELMFTTFDEKENKIVSHMQSEVWNRTRKIPEGLRAILESAVKKGVKNNPLQGTWNLTRLASDKAHMFDHSVNYTYKVYGDSTYFAFSSIGEDSENIDQSFIGNCGTFKYLSDERIIERSNVCRLNWTDRDNYDLIYYMNDSFITENWTRADLPDTYKRILAGIAPLLRECE